MKNDSVRLVKVDGEIIFCKYCGLLLNKRWNKRWDEKSKKFCNSKCQKLYKWSL